MKESQGSKRILDEILRKALEGEGLLPEEAGVLLDREAPDDWKKIFDCARRVTEKNFQRKVWFFAPLYFSSFCVNDCLYCGFRRLNRLLRRQALTPPELVREARFLWNKGHRSLLLIAGEHPVYSGVEKIAEYVWSLKRENLAFSMAVEVGPLKTEEYHYLRQLGVNRCLLFQETYSRNTYVRIHEGPKKDFDWRYQALERALLGGIEKVGLGILLGLQSYREDVIELLRHARRFKKKFGIFPATFSFPRLRPAHGVPPFPVTETAVSDGELTKLIAVARVAAPTVGIVLTTRESPAFRNRLLELKIGVTHLSAGSSTLPGGYTLRPEAEEGQFDLRDHRPLGEVEKEVSALGYEPVFYMGE